MSLFDFKNIYNAYYSQFSLYFNRRNTSMIRKLSLLAILLGLTGLLWEINHHTFTDPETGLMWQDDVNARTEEKEWRKAFYYCEGLSLDGFDDWQLPTIGQLRSLVDDTRDDPAVKKGITNIKSSVYWSRSPFISFSNFAWTVNFEDGDDGWANEDRGYYVRCVRESH